MPEELYTSRDFCELAEKFEELKRENEELVSDKTYLINAAMDGGDKYHYTAHDIAYRDLERKCKALEAEYAISNRELLIKQVEINRQSARIAELEAELAKMKEHFRQPTHGPCCTCQRCGQAYEDCRCDLDDVVDELDKANARIAELEAERRWIPFDWEHKENQPDHMQVCLVLTADNEMYSAMFLSDNCWTGLCRDFGRDEVAYWMQSPEPPEVK